MASARSRAGVPARHRPRREAGLLERPGGGRADGGEQHARQRGDPRPGGAPPPPGLQTGEANATASTSPPLEPARAGRPAAPAGPAPSGTPPPRRPQRPPRRALQRAPAAPRPAAAGARAGPPPPAASASASASPAAPRPGTRSGARRRPRAAPRWRDPPPPAPAPPAPRPRQAQLVEPAEQPIHRGGAGEDHPVEARQLAEGGVERPRIGRRAELDGRQLADLRPQLPEPLRELVAARPPPGSRPPCGGRARPVTAFTRPVGAPERGALPLGLAQDLRRRRAPAAPPLRPRPAPAPRSRGRSARRAPPACRPRRPPARAPAPRRPPSVAWAAMGTWQPPWMRARNPRSASTCHPGQGVLEGAEPRQRRLASSARASMASAPWATAGSISSTGKR